MNGIVCASEKERVSECVYVCKDKRKKVRQNERESERESVCVCV